MTADALTSWPGVEIDGSPLSDDLRIGLTGVVVDNDIHLPDMFTMIFDDPEHDLLTEASVRVGSAVTIKASSVGSTDSDVLIGGEVTALEASYESGWDRTIVRGYDKSHRLHRGRRTETYQNVESVRCGANSRVVAPGWTSARSTTPARCCPSSRR